jgi:hypothetical protein
MHPETRGRLAGAGGAQGPAAAHSASQHTRAQPGACAQLQTLPRPQARPEAASIGRFNTLSTRPGGPGSRRQVPARPKASHTSREAAPQLARSCRSTTTARLHQVADTNHPAQKPKKPDPPDAAKCCTCAAPLAPLKTQRGTIPRGRRPSGSNRYPKPDLSGKGPRVRAPKQPPGSRPCTHTRPAKHSIQPDAHISTPRARPCGTRGPPIWAAVLPRPPPHGPQNYGRCPAYRVGGRALGAAPAAPADLKVHAASRGAAARTAGSWAARLEGAFNGNHGSR